MRSIRLIAATTVILLGAWGCGDNGGGVEPGTDPVANFTAPACVAGTACTFTDASTDDGTITAWSWDFNGDATPDATTATATFTYPAAGTFQVTLTVTDNDGNTDSHTAPVTVTGGTANVAPTAAFNVPTCTVNVACLFTDASTDPEDGIPSAWRWNFGDGSAEVTDQNPSHTFTTTGSFNVTLTVTDGEGLTGTTTQSVTVSGTTGQSCVGTSATDVTCTITLAQNSTVTVTLESEDCEIGGNNVLIPPPGERAQIVFFNVCNLTIPQQRTLIDDLGAEMVFAAGTQLPIVFRRGADPIAVAPQAQITNTGNTWSISVDDGGNPGGLGEPDFRDVILTVTANPQ